MYNMYNMNDDKVNKVFEEFVKKEKKSQLVTTVVSLIVALIFIAMFFMAVKWSWIEIFKVWQIILTPNQSTAMSFLTLYLVNAMGGKRSNKG